MLHKRFKPAKCKTSLKLATSRIKLMKNKKGVQINQMKRDLAQLLETGQDRTARIRVEHVIREEKMAAAYDLIEIYCELIVARLPIIESQKTCPIDLKEAVTSVIFAAPRCSDISELSDIRKQFTAKYGKDFVSAALELRPDCGVSRMLVEKLSAVAPDLQTKIKVLSDVAKDHNIEWDPTTFEEKESKPPSDLLNGPPNLEKASVANADPPKTQPSNISDVHSHEEKHGAPPFDFSEQNRKYTLGTQKATFTDNYGETSSATTHADIQSSGITSERMETRQNWNMEFKDATSAAQAAAESAERAAIAARAAAQFSSHEKIANHRPIEPHLSNIRDDNPRVSATSGSVVEGHSRGSYESSSHDRKPKITSKHIDRNERDDASQNATEMYDGPSHGSNTGFSGPTLFRFNNDSIEDENLVNTFHRRDGYFEESLHEDQEGSSSPERESKTESGVEQKESGETENINFFAEEATKKQPSIRSTHSHSSISSDESNVGKRRVVGNPFAVVDQGGSPFRETTKSSPDVYSPRDDEAISDVDDDDDGGGGPRFDAGFEEDEFSEVTHSLENTHIWSPRSTTNNTVDQSGFQSHIFSESVSFGEQPSETDVHVSASFDNSDSESESEPSYVESSQNFNSGKSRIELNDLVEGEASFYNPEERPYELKEHSLDQESYDTLEDNKDSVKDLELNFGALTGGLRHKGGLRYPPYTKSATVEKSIEESSTTGGQTSLQSLGKGVSRKEDKKANDSILTSDSDADEKASKQANTTRSPTDAFFNYDGTDSEEEVSKQVVTRVQVASGLSRRTRGSPSVSYLKSRVEPESKTVIPSFSKKQQPGDYSLSDENPAGPQFYARRFKEEKAKQVPESQLPFSPSIKTAESGSIEAQLKPSKHSAYSNENPPSEPRAVNTNQGVETMPEPNIPTRELGPPRSTVESGGTKTSKSSGENLVKPSHVHPKLPEYDSLAARLQSLRNDRQ